MSNNSNMEEREKLFAKTRDELISKQMSNSETYDKSILSLSSAFLALSIAFIKDVVPLSEATNTIMLYLSWFCFSGAIVITISSFIYGQKGIRKLIKAAEEYYLKENNEAYKVSEEITKAIDRFNLSAGVVFIFAIMFSVSFVITNSYEVNSMNKGNKSNSSTIAKKGQPTNAFQKPSQSTSNSSSSSQSQQSGQTSQNSGNGSNN